MKNINIIFVVILSILLILSTHSPQTLAQNKTHVTQVNFLSKEKCASLEKILWNFDRPQFTDNSEQINKAYDIYYPACNKYPSTQATWKPDRYAFLHFNYTSIAIDYYNIKDYKKAAYYYDKAISEYEKTSTTPPNIGYVYAQAGVLHYQLGELQKAEEYLLKCPDQFTYVIETLGDIYFETGKFEKALFYYQKSVLLLKDELNRIENGSYLWSNERTTEILKEYQIKLIKYTSRIDAIHQSGIY